MKTISAQIPEKDAWDISADDFQNAGTVTEKLEFILNYALLAPSSHNSQPWLFRIHKNEVELYLDPTRRSSVVDPEDRELIISCGAALSHLKIALLHFGYFGGLEVFPDANNENLLARVYPGYQASPSPVESLLFHAIAKRRTNRLPFSDDPVPDTLLKELQVAAEREGAGLKILKSDATRCALADLVAEGDRIQWSNKSFRQELASWIRPNRSTSGDGIPDYAQGVDDLLSYAGPLVVRTFDMGEGQAAKDREIAAYSPAMVVLETDGNSRRDWLTAGQALSRVLLRARAENVWASFLNQPIEVPSLTQKLRETLGSNGLPQIILRLGYGQDIKPTPRRALSEVLK